MRLHELNTTHFKPKARRVGRGIAAGGGKTAGRGTKGQKSRTGANSNIPRTFEGGTTPLVQKLPKIKGFKSLRAKPVTVSVSRLGKAFEANATITTQALIEKGIISANEADKGVKIVGGSTKGANTYSFDTDDSLLSVSKSLLA